MSETLRNPVSRQESSEALERLARVYGVGAKREPVDRVYGKTSRGSQRTVRNYDETPDGGWVTVNPEAVSEGTPWYMAGSEISVATHETEGAVPLAVVDDIAEGVIKKHEASRAYLEVNEAIKDLATVDGVQLTHIPKGSGSRSGQYMSNHQRNELRGHADQIRDALDERAEENAFLERAKLLVPALEVIDGAFDGIDMSDDDKVQAAIRRALVAEDVFGKNTALQVGNLSNDELLRLVEFARSANDSQNPSGVDSLDSAYPAATLPEPFTGSPTGHDEAYPVAIPPAPFTGSPAERDEVYPVVALPESFTGSPTGHDEAYPVAIPPAPFGSAPMGPDIDPHRVLSPELQAKLEQLEVARQKWAAISTKRHGRLFDRRIYGYNDAKEQYDALVQETGRMQLQDQLEAATSRTEKNALAIGYYASEQNQLRELIRHETDAKFINKFANWMNKGSRKARIAKGLALGLVVGTGGSLALGAVGAVGAASAAIAASRFASGYTSRHKAGVDQLSDKQLKDAKTSIWLSESAEYDGMTHFNDLFSYYFEMDSLKEQQKRRTAIAWGAGSVAVGAAAGNLLGFGIDYLHNGPSLDTAQVSADLGSAPELSGQELPAEAALVAEKAVPETAVDTQAVVPAGHDILNYQDAYNIHSSEGWYETLKDMGIPKDNWSEVLKDAGPELQKQGWAYFDSTHAEWRINHTGQLSEQAMQTIKDSSAKLGYAFIR